MSTVSSPIPAPAKDSAPTPAARQTAVVVLVGLSGEKREIPAASCTVARVMAQRIVAKRPRSLREIKVVSGDRIVLRWRSSTSWHLVRS